MTIGAKGVGYLTTQEVIGILISITALASYLNYRFFRLHKSIGITLVTLILSLLLAMSGRLGWDVDDFALGLLQGISFNETFLHGMLGFLLFAGSLHVNTMELAKHKAIVALLATLSVVISTLLVGYGMYGVMHLVGIHLPLYYCLVFGALISPTDPIAVLGILKTVQAPKALEMKIAGESLFNDGMAIVLFFITLGLVSGQQEALTLPMISLYFLQQGGGGIALGLGLGWVTARIIRGVDDYEVAIIMTLAVVTGGYTLAHSVAKVSGPVCMAVAGLVIGSSLKKGYMSRETIQKLDNFWELLDEVLNAVLFVLIGLEFLHLSLNLDIVLASMGAIVICIAARWISISIPVGCMSFFRKFSPDVLMVMTWGGLRGGISIALALSLSGPYHDIIITITYAVVLFSIMVQGLTIGPLVKRLGHKNARAEKIMSSHHHV